MVKYTVKGIRYMKKEILMLNEEGDWLKGVVCVYDRSEKG